MTRLQRDIMRRRKKKLAVKKQMMQRRRLMNAWRDVMENP